MRKVGVIRNLDPLGRVVVPKGLREALDWGINDPIEIFSEGNKVILKKYAKCCIFCNKEEDLTQFKGKTMCLHCLAELQDNDVRSELMVSMEE